MHLYAKGISKAFGDKLVLNNLDIHIPPGVCTVITGPNGSGKSTLLRLLCGLIRPQRGKVEVVTDDKAFSPKNQQGLFGLATPEMQLYAELTAWENLQFFGRLRGEPHTNEELLTFLEIFDLTESAHQLVGSFSTGMRQKLRLAFAMAHKPFFLLLDEPTSNLDDAGRCTVAKIIETHKKNGTLIMATNDPQEANYFGEEFIRLDTNRNRVAG